MCQIFEGVVFSFLCWCFFPSQIVMNCLVRNPHLLRADIFGFFCIESFWPSAAGLPYTHTLWLKIYEGRHPFARSNNRHMFAPRVDINFWLWSCFKRKVLANGQGHVDSMMRREAYYVTCAADHYHSFVGHFELSSWSNHGFKIEEKNYRKKK